jgi:hypothetical protein
MVSKVALSGVQTGFHLIGLKVPRLLNSREALRAPPRPAKSALHDIDSFHIVFYNIFKTLL